MADERTIFDFPPGTIGIPAAERIRYPEFAHCLATTQVPPGTQIHMNTSASIVENANAIARARHGEWTWWQSDDHIWDRKATLLHLLRRDVDVVVPFMLKRKPPFVPVAFESQEGENYWTLNWGKIPNEGLVEVYAAGSGGMLVKNRVFDEIEKMQGHDRFFEYQNGEVLNEDLVFCSKIRDCGIPIYLDTEMAMGHLTTCTIWPGRDEEGWGVSVDVGEDRDGNRFRIFAPGTVPDDDSADTNR